MRIFAFLAGAALAVSSPVFGQTISGNPIPTGTGTVTSVGVGSISGITTSGGPVTTSGSVTQTLNSQTANTILAAPNGSAGAPSFRSMVAADLNTLVVPVANGGTNCSAASVNCVQNITGSQTANTFLAAPNGSAGNATFRAHVLADMPTSVQLAANTVGEFNTIESFRQTGYTDQQTVTAWAAAISAGTISVSRSGNRVYSLTGGVTITLPASYSGGYIDLGDVTFQRAYTGGSAVLTITAANTSYAQNWFIHFPLIDNNSLSGDQVTIAGPTAPTGGIYGSVFFRPRGRASIGGNGLTISGAVYENVIIKPDFRSNISTGVGVSTGMNTTGYGVYFVPAGTGVISSIDVYGIDTDGFLNGVYCNTNACQDTRWFGGTNIRAWNEGFKVDSFGNGSIYGLHTENNWWAGGSVSGTNGAGIKVSGGGHIDGIVGNSVGGQLYPLQAYAGNAKLDLTIGSVLDFTSTYLGVLQTGSTGTINLVGTLPGSWLQTGAVNLSNTGGGFVSSPQIKQTVQYLTGATPTPVYGAGNQLQIQLSANATIGAPTTTNYTPQTGDELDIAIIQGSSSAYTVAWNSLYNLRTGFTVSATLGSVTFFKMKYYNAKWHQSTYEVSTTY